MKPEPERDLLGENLRRALGACDDQVRRSYEDFHRRATTPPAPSRRHLPVGTLAVAASLLVCASVLVAIFASGGAPADTAGPGAQDKQDRQDKKAPPSEEQSLQAQIAFQEKLLEKTTDEHLLTSWRLLARGKVVMETPRYVMIQDTINHWAHHRGQMTVYLRLMGAQVPALYGPSADDNRFQ